jgi:putative hydrolase of the HAD superfamily
LTEAALRPEDGAVETIRPLDAADLHLGVVSDIDTREAGTMLESFGVTHFFQAVTTSEAVGYTKPDPRVFESALARWGGTPVRPS